MSDVYQPVFVEIAKEESADVSRLCAARCIADYKFLAEFDLELQPVA